MAHLLEKTRKITSILKRSDGAVAGRTSPTMRLPVNWLILLTVTPVSLIARGRLLGYFMRYKTNTDRVEQFFQTKIFPDDYIQGANMIYDTEANLTVDHDLRYFPVESRADFPRWFDDYCTDSCVRDST